MALLEIIKKNITIIFKCKGSYMLQKENIAYFAYGFKTEKIMYEELFWQQNMLLKLTKFFFDCLLPEIVDPRYPGKPIKNPDYIIQAQKKKKCVCNIIYQPLTINYKLLENI